MFREGEVICSEDDADKSVMMVKSGSVKLYTRGHLFETAMENQFFLFLPFVDNAVQVPISAVASSPEVEIYKMDASSLHAKVL